MQEFSKPYNPQETEDKIYQLWEKSGYFSPTSAASKAASTGKPDKIKNKPYTIVIPPPNITGELHMGHALNAFIQDILIRFKRMQGYKALWLPGTDHAGIATQNVVEKQLKKEGLTRHDLGREKFIERVWQWKEKYGSTILQQLKKLGASCDWSRTVFTMDPNYQKAVETAFLHYYKKGWIYQGDRVINWCTRCHTSLSDLELEYREEKGQLWFIRYPLADVILNPDDSRGEESRSKTTGSFAYAQDDSKKYITVATTRPETMLGDTAVAVSPKDKRYKKLVGKKLILPLINRVIPIISDHLVEAGFGTGAVKVTPAHDMADSDIGLRHKLDVIQVIGENGKMTDKAGKDYAGLSILEARKKVVEDLQKQGFLEKIEDYAHRVSHCYRCDSTIEPLLSKQWFLKMDQLAKKAIEAVENKKIKFHPDRWKKVYLDWLKNVKDWCISRQIWWGHKIPIEGVDDVLDTWFSSALWPFATLGFPQKTTDLKEFYPTSTLSTARDIINLWVARMIFSGLELANDIPFTDVIIHATVLTKDGKRMSKSLGTGIDPIDLVQKYGADATRFAFIYQTLGGQDMKFSTENMIMGQKFCNKIWNASRFVLGQIGNTKLQVAITKKTDADKKILGQLEKVTKSVTEDLEKFRFGQAAHTLYDFFWHDFCDIYIEAAKKQNTDQTKQVLAYTLFSSLKLLHPFMPFVTETIYQKLPFKEKELLLIETWPD